MTILFNNKPALNALWDITSTCNYSCNHCSGTQYASSSIGQLSFSSIESIVRNLISDRAINITLCGGEPFARSDIHKIIELLLDMPNIAGLTSFTNGSLLEKRGMPLLDKGVNIIVSLDGVNKETNDQVRGIGTFQQTVRGIDWLVDNNNFDKPGAGSLSISYTITSIISSPEEMLEFCESKNISNLYLTPMFEVGNGIDNNSLIPTIPQLISFSEKMLVESDHYKVNVIMEYAKPAFIEYVNKKHKKSIRIKYNGCKSVSSEFIIRPDGLVVPCRAIYPETSVYFKLGIENSNLTKNKIDSILRSPGFHQVECRKNPGKYPNYSPCCGCKYAGVYCDPCWLGEFEQNQEIKQLCKFAYEEMQA